MLILIETLRREWRQSIYWGLVFAFFAGYAGILVPDMEGMQNYVRILEMMPSVMLQMFGLDDVSSLASPEGFISFSYFVYMGLGLSIFAVWAGLNITMSEEDRGILDMQLSLPLPRHQIVIGRFAAFAVLMLIIVMFGMVTLLITDNFNDNFSVDFGRYLLANVEMLAYGVLVMAVTLLISVTVRSRGRATMLASGFVGGSYMLDTIGNMANNSMADTLRELSYFRHYDAMNALNRAFDPLTLLVLMAIIGVFLLASVTLFQRRDVGV